MQSLHYRLSQSKVVVFRRRITGDKGNTLDVIFLRHALAGKFNTGFYLPRNFILIRPLYFMDSRILVTASGSYVDVGLKYPLGAPSSPINQ